MLSKSLLSAIALGLLGCRLGEPRSEARATGGSSSSPAPSATEAPSAAPATLYLGDDAAAPPAAPTPAPAAPTPGTPKRERVVLLGDSISDPRVGGGGYWRFVQSACPAVEIESFAQGGFMVNQMRRRFVNEVTPRLPGGFDTLIVFGGVNDLYSDETAGRTVEKIQSDLAAIYRDAKAAGLRVIALTVAPWGGFTKYYNPRRAASTQRLNAWIRSQPEAGLVDVVVDTHPLLLCGSDTDRICPDYEPPFHDGLHFGKAGQERVGRVLLERAFPDCPAAH